MHIYRSWLLQNVKYGSIRHESCAAAKHCNDVGELANRSIYELSIVTVFQHERSTIDVERSTIDRIYTETVLNMKLEKPPAVWFDLSLYDSKLSE